MTIDFVSLLTPEERKEVLLKRISQLASQGYQHNLNRDAANRNGRADLMAEADEAISEIETTIKVYQDQLNSLPPELR
jgi:hypothetical protein